MIIWNILKMDVCTCAAYSQPVPCVSLCPAHVDIQVA